MSKSFKRWQQQGQTRFRSTSRALVLDLDSDTQAIFQKTYTRLSEVSSSLHLLLATYFGNLGSSLPFVLHLPVPAVHLDLVRAPEQLEQALAESPAGLTLSLGIVDGRNVWRTEFDRALALIERAIQTIGSERILIGPSCSLLHVPVDLAQETQVNDALKQWLAFAHQKIEEIVLLAHPSDRGHSCYCKAT